MTAQTMVESPALARLPGGGQDLGGLLGLRDGREAAFPLREVRVRASILGDCCRTVVEQLFDNPYDTALEAVHIFPLPHEGAVTEMELRAGPVTVRAECREREEAGRIFRRAREEGRRAALLDQERPDIHTLRVTNVPPKTSVAVRMVVIERLRESDGAQLWRFPLVVAPRYTPGIPAGHTGPGTTPDTSIVPDASRLQPPLLLGGGARLDLEVEIASPVAAIESSLHAVRTALGPPIRIAPSARAALDRDFVLRITPEAAQAEDPAAFASGDYTMVVVPPSAVTRRLAEHAAGPRMPRDAVFVIDISGSMSGSKIEAARCAVAAALHGLERGDRFRLVAFDNNVEVFRREFSDYTAAALADADAWIAALEARGGTEMLAALDEALDGVTAADRLRTVLFVTDGQATNEDQLVAAVSGRPRNAVLFTVGIDTAVNASLLQRLARAGGGTCELLTPGDDVEEAIVRLEARFATPVAEGVHADSGEPARADEAVLFDGVPLTLLLKGAAHPIHVRANTAHGALILPCGAPAMLAFPISAIWARERIGWLEDELARSPKRLAEIRSQILALALEHHLASRFTSLVAVEERTSEKGELTTIVQPSLLPAQWSRHALGPSMSLMPDTAPDDGSMAYMVTASQASFDALPSPLASMPRRDGPTPPPLRAARPPEGAGRRASDGVRQQVSAIAVSQEADGSFGGKVDRTAAVVVALVLLGNTRRTGTRRRVVAKAAGWLASQAPDAIVEAILRLLDAAESSGGHFEQEAALACVGSEVVGVLRRTRPEGQFLEEVMAQRW